MEEVKLTEAQELLFEIYSKGALNEDCHLNDYLEKLAKIRNH